MPALPRALAAALTVAALHAGPAMAEAASPAAAAAPAPRPPADADAVREVRRGPPPGRSASARAIGHYLTARRKVVAGDLVGATEELRLAVAYDDGSAELRAAWAEALALTGRIEAAEGEARRAISLEGGGRAASAAQILLGRILSARGETKPALEALAAARAIEVARLSQGEAGDPEPWRLAADVLLEAGDADAALAMASEAATRLGHDGRASRELGRALLERHDLPRAGRALRRAVEVRPGDEEAWRLLARVEEALRRPAEARDAWMAALRLDPDDGDALLGLGRLALQADDVGAAREWFGRHLRLAGEGAEPFLQVAYEWLEAHQPEEALVAAREGLGRTGSEPRLRLLEGLALQELRRWAESAESLRQVPAGAGDTWFSARQALAYSLSRSGRPGEAVASLDAPLAARPGDPRLVTARALALARAGRAGEAIDLLRAVLSEREKAGERSAELWAALADALVQAGRAEEAVAELSRAAEARPRDAALRYALANACERAGRPEEAVAQMRLLLAQEPDHAEALNFVGYTLAEQGVRLEEAEALVRRALALSPRSGHMIDSLGYIRFRRGDVAGAVELLEQADRLIGPDASVLEHLGDAYRAAARPADAAATYRRALRSMGEEAPAEQVALRASLERKLEELARGERRPVAR